MAQYTGYIGWYAIFTPRVSSKKVPGGSLRTSSRAFDFINERKLTAADIARHTLGRATVADIRALGACYAIDPRYFNSMHTLIMAPGYERIAELNKIGSGAYPLQPTIPPSRQWSNAIERVFDCDDVQIVYGMVIEAV